MSHTVILKCEKCGNTEATETKDWILSERGVSFEYLCSCGFQKKYENLSVVDFEKISIDEEGWYSDWSGLSKEKIESYVYPPDVMMCVDLERRKLKGMEMKERLKASRQAYPEQVEENWWCVYKVVQPKLSILYNHRNKSYRIIYQDHDEIYPNILEFWDAVRNHF